MIKNKILTILPLTENYSKSKAGAVSLFIKDNNKFSKYKNFVVGSTNLKDFISKNYKNFKVSRRNDYAKWRFIGFRISREISRI